MGQFGTLFLFFVGGVAWSEPTPVDFKDEMTPRVAANPCKDVASENFKLVTKGKREDKIHAYLEACKAEMGPLPDLTAQGVDQKVPIGVKLNGKIVEKKEGKYFYVVPGLDPQPVEPEYLSNGGLITCDNPSLAGFKPPCNFESFLLKYKSVTEGTYWVGIERPASVSGIIGWNRKTGASCFIQLGDAKNSAAEFGKFLTSTAGSAERSESFSHAMKGTSKDNCLNCHTDADPFLGDPNVSDALKAIGITDVRKNKSFNAGEYHYHVPAIHFTDLEHNGKVITVRNPNGSKNETCTTCHILTNGRLFNRAIQDELVDYPARTSGEKPLHHKIPAWMTIEEPDEAQTYAVKQLQQFANHDPAPGVNEDQTIDHLPGFPKPEKPTGGLVCVHPGFISLKWNQTEKNPKLGDDVRFSVTAKMTIESPGPNGPITRTESKVWKPVGLGADNCHFPRSQWEFKHQMPEVPGLKKIVYEIKPVRLSVNDNGEKFAYAYNDGPPVFVELPLAEGRVAPQRWPNCEGGEAHENSKGKDPVHSPKESSTL